MSRGSLPTLWGWLKAWITTCADYHEAARLYEEFRGLSDADLAATFLLTALNGIATWYRPDGRLSADRIADHFVDLALRSLTEDHR